MASTSLMRICKGRKGDTRDTKDVRGNMPVEERCGRSLATLHRVPTVHDGMVENGLLRVSADSEDLSSVPYLQCTYPSVPASLAPSHGHPYTSPVVSFLFSLSHRITLQHTRSLDSREHLSQISLCQDLPQCMQQNHGNQCIRSEDVDPARLNQHSNAARSRLTSIP